MMALVLEKLIWFFFSFLLQYKAGLQNQMAILLKYYQKLQLQNNFLAVPTVAQWVKDPTSIHEDVHLVPGLT